MNLKVVDEPIIARAMLNTIYLGNRYFLLPERVKAAVVSHEVGHCMGNHTIWRVLCLFFAPFLLSWVCKKQEFLADRHAVRMGHGQALLLLLSVEFKGDFFSPSHELRRKKINLELSALSSISRQA